MSDEKFKNMRNEESFGEVEEQTVQIPEVTEDTIVMDSETTGEQKTETLITGGDDREVVEQIEEVLEENAAPQPPAPMNAGMPSSPDYGTTAYSVEYEGTSYTAGAQPAPQRSAPQQPQSQPQPQSQTYQASYAQNSGQQSSQPQASFQARPSTSTRFGRTETDGPIRIGLLVWGIVLLIFGLMAFLGAVAAPINGQFVFTTLLALAGVAFIVLAIVQSNKTSVAAPQMPQGFPGQTPNTTQPQGQHTQANYGGSFHQGGPTA